jgi:allantoinase
VRTGEYHNLFDFSAIVDRQPLRWPDGGRVALVIVPNVEFYELDDGEGHVDVREASRCDYGNRVGVWRLMELLDRYQVRATVALHEAACRNYPRVIEAMLERRWELMGHGLAKPGLLSALNADQERAAVFQTVATIHQASGQKVRGWLGPGLVETPRTLEYLKAAGVEYVTDWVNDDQPYRFKNGLYSIPYTIDLNDTVQFRTPGLTPAEYAQMICDAFDVLYDEGAEHARVLCIALHPFIIGAPHRIRHFERALEHICSRPGVWRATGSEVLDWYKQYEAGAQLPGGTVSSPRATQASA